MARYRQGRAPEFLREAFTAAVLDAVREEYTPGNRIFKFNLELRRQWDSWDAESRLYWASGQLWRSSDLMPPPLSEALQLPGRSSYGRGARKVRAMLRDGISPRAA
jgi:hypothetical protein